MLPILAQLYSELPMVPASWIRIWMKLWAWQTEKKEEHVISPQNKFCSVAFHPHPPFFPSTSPPLLHLGSDDSIGSSFKRISITETVFSLSVQASSHISASLSCLLFHSVPLLFPGRGLLPFYVTSVCVCWLQIYRQVLSLPWQSEEEGLELKCQQSGKEKSAVLLTLVSF